ncbi:hypothetical protein C8R44DRAFT_855340 [Mycena epipterygia]|nr:hypothetical protein C8R44DRAFT_855340 [Mycena epipterygia]
MQGGNPNQGVVTTHDEYEMDALRSSRITGCLRSRSRMEEVGHSSVRVGDITTVGDDPIAFTLRDDAHYSRPVTLIVTLLDPFCLIAYFVCVPAPDVRGAPARLYHSVSENENDARPAPLRRETVHARNWAVLVYRQAHREAPRSRMLPAEVSNFKAPKALPTSGHVEDGPMASNPIFVSTGLAPSSRRPTRSRTKPCTSSLSPQRLSSAGRFHHTSVGKTRRRTRGRRVWARAPRQDPARDEWILTWIAQHVPYDVPSGWRVLYLALARELDLEHAKKRAAMA